MYCLRSNGVATEPTSSWTPVMLSEPVVNPPPSAIVTCRPFVQPVVSVKALLKYTHVALAMLGIVYVVAADDVEA